ncbi:MAG: OmpH family outer membrane protein [Dysgonamonadaceae bacterium]|jgi:outer membrane protein|nr:OmpH family outer membrane protein [Dysgonamonadaceae bacterium]
MLKKIVLFALLLIPVMGFAQEKIAYFKSSDVIPAMPEYTQMLDSLRKSEAALQAELETMADEYSKKVTAFSEQQATLTEAIKTLRLKEIERIRERTESFQRDAAQIQDDLQKTLFVPIETKVRKALQEVGAENQFTYIVNADLMLYISPQSQDATPLVKTKLGVK